MIKIIIIIKWYCIFCFLFPVRGNSAVNIILEGLNSKLEYNIRKQLSSLQNNDTIYIDSNICNQINNIVKFNLKSVGYYNPKIDIILLEKKIDNRKVNIINVKVFIGKPVIVREINIHVYGQGKYDADYQKIIQDSRLCIGRVLNHNDYENLKNKLYNLALSKGYLDAKFNNSQLVVIPDLNRCIWNVHFYSGTRYIVEEIKFHGSYIQERYLKNISNIRVGEYYQNKSIVELSHRLSATNWFDSVFVSSSSNTYLKKKTYIKCSNDS